MSDAVRKGSRVVIALPFSKGTVTGFDGTEIIVRPDFQPGNIRVPHHAVELLGKSSKRFRVIHGDACNYAGDADSLSEAVERAMPLGHFSVWEIEEYGPRKVAVKEDGSPVRFLKEDGTDA